MPLHNDYLRRTAPSLIASGIGLLIIGVSLCVFPKSPPPLLFAGAALMVLFGLASCVWGASILIRTRERTQ